jgi:CheY-like chemotaxis protein
MNPTQQIPLQILLAEDDPDDRFFFENALKQIPIETQLHVVKDGEGLMEYLSVHIENLPDVLFLDLSMPRKTGFECLTEIKENEKMKELPVVVFTTSFGRSSEFEQGMIETLVHIGAQEYVRKPDDVEELKKIIHASLNRVLEKIPDNE